MAKSLQVLDLHHNQLEKLPDEIGSLKSLRVLYLHHNKLKKLPDSLGNLTRLQSLDLGSNNLKELPSNISKLKRLRTLDVSNNVKLKKLPKQLGHCQSLDKLIGPDLQTVQYPEAGLCKQGTEAVMRFLAKGIYHIFIPPPFDSARKRRNNGGSQKSVRKSSSMPKFPFILRM